MIARALSALGLMKRSEHEAVKRQAAADKQLIEHLRADVAAYDAKFKLAAANLAKQADEIAGLHRSNAGFAAQVEALRPDALLWRKARDKRAKGRVS